ncbi:DoxX family protein [Agarivorans albus]|uniref:DoxX family protein n=1 Tax=Agarivorans albus MKT 106 TaxID=1331007 RepID=R9PJ35_AGAAL|nr:DoxX family protein [Agarivorans albus]GAD01340.1 hypothetical protein AALB_1420 [Agarivorans albus MKT 106]
MIEFIHQTFTYLATGFLFTLFLFTSSIKISRWHQYIVPFQLGFMKKYGLNGLVYTLIGVAELLGALGLLLAGSHVLGTLAASGLFFLSLGAFLYHLKFDSFQFGIPALLCGSLALVLFASHFAWLTELPTNLAITADMLDFQFSLKTAIPFLVGASVALKFSLIMSETATTKMLNADKEDPYAA